MNTKRSPLPRLTPAFWGWAALDMVGVLVLALGAAYLMEGRASLLPGFPANSLQAWLCMGGGIATVFVAAVKMLVEVMHSASAGNKAANDSHFS
ncbi:hypothetical protein [Zoogloea sp.]|uniref:hypothetical protein n=1 Tax=Zoogloea sp. TaxID=49181 RepID=UPI0025D78CF5|nr:hypothetical protein [Zoogloea sp.]MCK6392878.1 hypothetical protein [Zoogloea sp.]